MLFFPSLLNAKPTYVTSVSASLRVSRFVRKVPVTREIMRKWSAAMKRLRPREHAASVTERDEARTEDGLLSAHVVARVFPELSSS